MDKFNLNVGNRIRKKRKELGYTQEKLSELAEINNKYIYEIETGRKGLSAKILFKISQSLGVTMDFLVSGDQNLDDYRIILSLIGSLKKEDRKNVEDIIRNIVIIKNNHIWIIQKENSILKVYLKTSGSLSYVPSFSTNILNWRQYLLSDLDVTTKYWHT